MRRNRVTPLPSCVTYVGAKRWRWFCWRCRKHSPSTVYRQSTAVKQLDQHVTLVHGGAKVPGYWQREVSLVPQY